MCSQCDTGLQENSDIIDAIDNNIQWKITYNDVVRELVRAMEMDLAANPDFQFADWIGNDVSGHSYTFDVCKRVFKIE